MSSEIEPMELKEMMEVGDEFILVDVREPFEREICRIGNSVLIPPDKIQEEAGNLDKDKLIILYCHHGGRSMQALVELRLLGFKKLKNLKGGIDRWAREVEPEMARY